MAAGARRGLLTSFATVALLAAFPLLPSGESVRETRNGFALVAMECVNVATLFAVERFRHAEHRFTGFIQARDTLLDERAALLRAVLSSEERWHVLTDAIPALITQLNPDGEIVYCNRQLIDYYGATLDQLRDGAWLSAIHPDDADDARARWNRALASGARAEFQQRVRRHDGEYRRQLVIVEPLRESSGEITSWLSALVDIEDLKRVEDALVASEQRYRLLSEAMPALVAIIDLRGDRDYRNQAFYEYTGLTEAEAIDWLDRGLIFEEDLAAAAGEWRATTAKGEIATAELRVRRHDGVFRWHLVRAVPLGSTSRWLLVATDIDDRREAELAALDAIAQHRHAEEQLTLLVEASSSLIESLDLTEMIPRILRMSVRFVKADAYALWSLNDEKDRGASWRPTASRRITSPSARRSPWIASPPS